MITQASPNIKIAGKIDHTYLSSDCTPKDITVLCEEAIKYKFRAVCIPPYYVFQAKKLLQNSLVKICTVIGFPMGYSTTGAKVEEIKRATNEGADELDVVLNIAAIKNNDWNAVKNDIDSVTMISHLKGKKIKLIIEIGLLEKEEILKVCQMAQAAGIDFIKTSTGFNNIKTTPDDIRFLKAILPSSIKIKASGGIRTLSETEAILAAGADCIGTSSGMKIIGSY